MNTMTMLPLRQLANDDLINATACTMSRNNKIFQSRPWKKSWIAVAMRKNGKNPVITASYVIHR